MSLSGVILKFFTSSKTGSRRLEKMLPNQDQVITVVETLDLLRTKPLNELSLLEALLRCKRHGPTQTLNKFI